MQLQQQANHANKTRDGENGYGKRCFFENGKTWMSQVIQESEGLCCVSVRFEHTQGFQRGLSRGKEEIWSTHAGNADPGR